MNGYGDFGARLAEIEGRLLGLHNSLGHLGRQLGVMQGGFGAVDDLRGQVAKLSSEREDAKRALQQPRFIEDIPGPRMPYTYAISIPFAVGDTAAISRGVTIAADGPFVVTALAAYWRIANAAHALVGRWLPPSQTGMRVHSLGTAPTAGTMEFAFKIVTGGSGRFWQSDWLPGPMFDATIMNRPFYAGIAGWIERANTVTVEARPEFAIPANANGDVWFYLHGYQLLIPVNLSEQFGWRV